MKFRMPYEIQIINAMLVLLCTMLGLFMFSIVNSSVFGAVVAVISIDFVLRFLIKAVKRL